MHQLLPGWTKQVSPTGINNVYTFTPGSSLQEDMTGRGGNAAFADLTTLTMPATKPSRKNTMSPKGDVDKRWSMPQPITAPTRTPATNSDESRRARAMADALAAPSPFPPAGWSVLTLRLSRSADNRWLRLPSLAESAASSGDFSPLPFPPPSVRSAMFGDPTRCRWKQKLRPVTLLKPRGPY